MLIAIEGSDGIGKGSVVEALGLPSIAFPAKDTVTYQPIRDYLSRKWRVEYSHTGPQLSGEEINQRLDLDDHLSAMAFQSLLTMNRIECHDIMAAAKDHPTNHLVCDRHWQSGWVYGQLDGLDPDWLEVTSRAVVKPDLNILLDAPAEVCLQRRLDRGGKVERYDLALEGVDKIRKLYGDLWARKRCPEAQWIEWLIVDAITSLDDVMVDMRRAISMVCEP